MVVGEVKFHTMQNTAMQNTREATKSYRTAYFAKKTTILLHRLCTAPNSLPKTSKNHYNFRSIVHFWTINVSARFSTDKQLGKLNGFKL